ncbi:MAG: hypothetical protein AABM40_11855 [Chloroflexota bacterium]
MGCVVASLWAASMWGLVLVVGIVAAGLNLSYTIVVSRGFIAVLDFGRTAPLLVVGTITPPPYFLTVTAPFGIAFAVGYLVTLFIAREGYRFTLADWLLWLIPFYGWLVVFWRRESAVRRKAAPVAVTPPS